MTVAKSAERSKDKSGARVSTRRQDGRLDVALAGRWTTQALGAESAGLAEIAANGAKQARIDLSQVEELDTAGAWVVHKAQAALAKRGLAVELVGGRAAHLGLIETIAGHDLPHPAPPKPENPIVAVVLRAGRGTYFFAGEARDLINFLGACLVVFMRSLLQPHRLRLIPLIAHMEQTGLNAMPIVGLLSFLIGVVLAYQGADQLARFGAQIFTVNLVGVGVLREMGIILTAIIVAGRSGSAFTAQIGTMKVNEEIDAMRTIGLDPMDVLVMPRIFALILVLPLLTFYADLMGLFGGAVMCLLVLDISLVQFARQINDAVPLWSFWVGIIKAPVFAFVIAMIGCFEGLKVGGSAESVGRRTTQAVVEAIFLVIVLDAAFSILFSYIGI